MKKLTVKDLLDNKGKKQLTEVYAHNSNEAAACELAGIDMLVTSENNNVTEIRNAAPNTFLTVGLAYGEHINETRILDASFHAIKLGADAIYCPQGLRLVRAIADEGIPVVGHVGFVPYKASIFGGFKAVGKTAKEAMKTLELTKAYQDAGAIGVEIEIVPHKVATYISQNVDILLISMGSGNGCDAQYLFADDILGYNKGHIPRHAKVYCDHKSEYEKLFKESIAAFKAFKNDVDSKNYPEKKHNLEIGNFEYKNFLSLIKTKDYSN